MGTSETDGHHAGVRGWMLPKVARAALSRCTLSLRSACSITWHNKSRTGSKNQAVRKAARTEKAKKWYVYHLWHFTQKSEYECDKGKANASLWASVRAPLMKGEDMYRALLLRRLHLKRRMRHTRPTLNDFTALSGPSIEFSFRHLVH